MTEATPDPSRSRSRRWLLFWGGLVVGAIFLAFTASRTDVEGQLALVKGFSATAWFWIAGAFGLEVLHIVIRAMRWSMFFPEPRPRPMRMISAMSIGYLYNNLIPRSGEFVRMFLVGRWRPDVGVAGTAVTIGADRLIDVATVIFMSSVVLLASPYGMGELVGGDARAFWGVVGITGFVASGVAVAVRFAPALERFALERFTHLPERLARVAEAPTRHVFKGLAGLGRLSARARAGLLFWLVLEIGVTLLMHSMTARAFGITMPWFEVAFVLAASGFGAMVPSGPGNVGSMVLSVTLAAGYTSVAPAAGAYGVLFFGSYFAMRTGMGLGFLIHETRRSAAEESIKIK